MRPTRHGLKRSLPTLALSVTMAISLWAGAPRGEASPRSRSGPAPVVIAVVEGGGFNALHQDFKARGRIPVVPGMPRPAEITLPDKGSFAERLKAAQDGPLGSLQPGSFHRVAGTRIVGIYVPDDDEPTNIFEERFHATGTISSAAGLRHGTDPEALVVFVPDGGSKAWAWLAKQDWIDIISTSYYSLIDSGSQHQTCPARSAIREIVDKGRLVFSSAGNYEQAGPMFAPSGVPEAYQVGGVDDEGKTYLPGVANQGQSVTPTRPYETGDRFEFPAADSESLNGSMAFGGTSGATPSTAGRAAVLLRTAREILGSRWTGIRDGALAVASKGRSLPDQGPLADGRLERAEFVNLLHHVAVPAEPASPVRYLVEGYGALNESAVDLAKQVLAGTAEEPKRPEEDAAHEAVDEKRGVFFPSERCG